jgi:predicted nucleic acid-binding protein
MVAALFDTNILIDFLNGVADAKTEVERYETRAISMVTWMEVMAGAQPEVEAATRDFLLGFEQIPIDQAIAEQAVGIRRQARIKLPDAIIWASARSRSMLLVTRNRKDFPASEPWVRIPYSR